MEFRKQLHTCIIIVTSSAQQLNFKMIYFLVLALEPSNTTAQEFLPVIDERIKLGS